MSLSKDQIEKLYGLKEKLLITYKAAQTEEQKKRISKNIFKIEKIINDLEDGKEINPDELRIFSGETKVSKTNDNPEDENINYIAKIEYTKISDASKDSEMNQIYSFILFFEHNFLSPLSDTYLKLDYSLKKKRDIIFAHYEAINHLLKEYKDDLEVIKELRLKEQIEKYKTRLEQQKAYYFIKLSEYLHELKKFLQEIIADYKSGRSNFFNPKEKYITNYVISEKTEFEGALMEDIVKEAIIFVNDFLEILRMPNFKKNLE